MSIGTNLKKMADNFNSIYSQKTNYKSSVEKPIYSDDKRIRTIEDIITFIENNIYFTEYAKNGQYKYKIKCHENNKKLWKKWKEIATHPLTHKDVTFQYKKSKFNSKHYLIFSWK